MIPLAAEIYQLRPIIEWAQVDSEIPGDEIAFYDVYISIDGGEFEIWKSRTTETSAVLELPRNHNYSFYVVATNVFGEQESKLAAAATSAVYYGPAWQNPIDAFDTNENGRVTAIDALLVINELRIRRVSATDGKLPAIPSTPGYQHPHFDTNGDGRVTSLDALLIMNEIARRARQAEREMLPINSPTTSASRGLEQHQVEFATAQLDQLYTEYEGGGVFSPALTKPRQDNMDSAPQQLFSFNLSDLSVTGKSGDNEDHRLQMLSDMEFPERIAP